MESEKTTKLELRKQTHLSDEGFNALNVEAESTEKKSKLNIKKRLPLVLAAVVLITLIILYATSVINTMVFTAILLSIIGLASLLMVFILIKNVKTKKGIKKWIVMLAKLVPMIPLLSLYLAGVITTTLFIILKAVMLGTFIIFTLTMLIFSKLKSRKAV